ncbi:prostatic acid phosphatase-like [Harmonia axyridis]|uniref:prostatic acid phosphatase-like n=1 Tax=Harmonia axyridis TaxID=115357 RepID=UPI001E279920|nr:prostatic acid phosphatase-like [Harmonia axyridis]
MFLRSVSFGILFQIISCTISTDELVATVMVFRHGARVPRLFHPNDPYQNMSFWPAPKGELTEEGKQQAYELGQWVRQNYAGFLPEKYASEDFFIYSSGIDRTLMSASLFAAGLYPSISCSNLPFQPIPIHSKPPQMDTTILSDQSCPKREYILENNILNTKFFKKIAEDNREVYEYLSHHMGMPVTSFKGLDAYYDTFLIERWHNLTLPEWTKEVYPEKLRELALYNLVFRTYDLDSTRFRIGSLYSEILAYLASFTSEPNEFKSDFERGNKGRKMMAISGHDVNLADLLAVLKCPLDVWPSFSSSVIFELKKNNNQDLYVSVFYKNITGIVNVNINGCGSKCELNKFIENVRPIIMDPKDWKHQCILDKKYVHIEDQAEKSKYL